MSYYIYLIVSLPMLAFGMKMPFSYQQFLEIVRDKIDEKDLRVLEEISLEVRYPYENIAPAALKRWHAFECALRNELVRIRASRTQHDENKFLKGDGYTDPSIARVAMSAHRSPSILEAERILDQERWAQLGECALGHYFDIEFLTTYALKLCILERWQKINSADSEKELAEALSKEV